MGTGFVGIISAELHFPESRSLKTKRKDLQSVKSQLIQRFHVAVAEVDHHDTWQRAQVTAACVGRDHLDATSILDSVERFLCSRDFETVIVQREVTKPGDCSA